ncbi:hypothetical protein B0H13DRAFT_2665509 [Mycena leptocephala]|nr:hypothetical protein B0H13DRAFT_2665509 [Mycena leptocephala]
MESPFQSILRTNAAPSDSECRNIHDFLTGSREEASALAQEIIRLQHRIDELVQKQHTLAQFIDSHLALVSLACRLPEDVVCEIFIACTSTENPGMSARGSPLLLCQICHAWRRVALSTPQLWASIHISVSTSSDIPRLSELITSWLLRSGSLPLSISLEYHITNGVKRVDCDVSPILTSLTAFSRRWKNIRMILPTFDSFAPLSHLPTAELPILHSVSVSRLLPDHIPSLSPWGFLSFVAATRVRSASIPTGYKLSTLSLPWTHLLYLKITNEFDHLPFAEPPPTLRDVISILRQCSALETCTLDITIVATGPDPTLETVFLPNLWHLELSLKSARSLETLFLVLVIPNLRSLILSAPHSNGPPPLCLFLPSIERLSLRVTNLASHELVQRLQRLPLLSELALYGEPVLPAKLDGRQDLGFLAPLAPTSGPLLCPNLSRLSLFELDGLSDAALLAFIQTKMGPTSGKVPRLTHFTAYLQRAMECDILQPLQPLIAGGLHVSLNYCSLSENTGQS